MCRYIYRVLRGSLIITCHLTDVGYFYMHADEFGLVPISGLKIHENFDMSLKHVAVEKQEGIAINS